MGWLGRSSNTPLDAIIRTYLDRPRRVFGAEDMKIVVSLGGRRMLLENFVVFFFCLIFRSAFFSFLKFLQRFHLHKTMET